jgi:hypothetical protein
VTLRHIFTVPGFSQRGGFCRSGARRWFEQHGIDWAGFVRNGIDDATLLATGDALAVAVVEWARRCEEEGLNGRL